MAWALLGGSPHGELRAFAASVPARDAVLVRHGRVASRFWSRLRGLLGTHELVAGDGLLITPCSSVHMLGMRYAIDVVYVDDQDRVVGIDPSLAPGKIGGLYRSVRYVIELPAGTCDELGVAVGDVLVISPTLAVPAPKGRAEGEERGMEAAPTRGVTRAV
ncbi:MAG: DUF192 domain-containing protein [Anaerolineae bacterium]